MAEMRYVGRGLAVVPANLGALLEELCTVTRLSRVTEWVENESTGVSFPQQKTVEEEIPLFWYDRKNDAFVTYSGFGPEIRDLLAKKTTVRERSLIDSGLGDPDLSAVKRVVWRKRQKEVFAAVMAYDRGIIKCPTAWGKTFLIKQLAKVYPKAEILITVDSADIVRDIYDGLKFDLGRQLGIVTGGKRTPSRVTVATSQSLHRCPKDVNLILADECHKLCTENYLKKFNKFPRAKVFGFTATPDGRSDKAERFGTAIFGPLIKDITFQEGVEGGNIVPIQVRLYRSTGPDVSKMHNQVAADRMSLWRNKSRNELIARIAKDLAVNNPDAQILIMVDKTEHAYVLGQLLPEYAIVSGELSAARVAKFRKQDVMVEGQEPCTVKQRQEHKKAFESGQLKYAIATKVWSKGVDFRDLSFLIRADGVGSPIDSGQVPGRVARLGKRTNKELGTVIDFYDDFSPNLRSRSDRRLAVYRKNGWHIQRCS